MNAATLVKNYSSIVNNIVSQLDSLEVFREDELISKFNLLQKEFLDLAKITNDGRGPTELRVEKLKALKKWLQEYSDKENFLLQTVPQRYKNKTVAIDSSTLDLYQEYAQLALNYMTELSIKYKNIKEKTLPFLTARKAILKNINSFQLDEENLISLAGKEDNSVIEAITHTPQKTINSIRSILRAYGRFIKNVEEKEKNIISILEYFESNFALQSFSNEKDILQKVYTQLNRRNKLLQSLVKNLSNIRKTIENNDFKHKLAIIKEYQVGLEEMSKYLSSEVIDKLSLTALTSPIEDELDKSPGRIKKYNPIKDPGMDWPESNSTAKDEKKEDMNERVDRVLRHQELADISQRPGQTLSPDDKKKYEQLWETAQTQNIKKLVRFANYLVTKYGDL